MPSNVINVDFRPSPVDVVKLFNSFSDTSQKFIDLAKECLGHGQIDAMFKYLKVADDLILQMERLNS